MSPSVSADELVAMLPKGGRTLVTGCSTESLLLANAVERAGDRLGAMTFTGIFVPGLNRNTYVANSETRVETFFLTPELKAAGPAVTFLPLCYDDISRHLRAVRFDAALMMVAPPDGDGLCSFGPAVDFLAELWPRIPLRLAHVNPLMPRTNGHLGIPLERISAFMQAPQSLLEGPDPASDPVTEVIAANVAALVTDGATVQTGLGKVPGAVLRAMTGKRGLRIHSGLIGDAVVDLEESGALAPGNSVRAGVAVGTGPLYDAVGRSTYSFHPVSVTHDVSTIGAIPNFVAINSALEVDLFGQAYSEAGPQGLMSGPGGASDFARGARLAGGLRIVALAATAARGSISRIVAPNAGAGPVSFGRMDVDFVVTEFGAADLRAKTYAERADAMIAIAAPEHRQSLRSDWRRVSDKL